MMDIYKISIALAMTSNHNAVLSALSSQMLGVHASVNQLQGGFSRLKLAIGGAFAIGAGIALLDTMAKIVEKTKDYSDELVKLQRLGGPMTAAVESGAMSKRAFDIAQRVPMKVPDLLAIPGATYSVLGQEKSMAVWEELAKYSWVSQSTTGHKTDPSHDLTDLIRAGDLSGRLTDKEHGGASVEELRHYLDMVTKITAATHGLVNAQTLLGMAKTGGAFLRGLSDEGFYTQAIMAQAMGGPRSGTAFLSLYQQMAAGSMLSRSAEGLQDVGLLKPNEWRNDHGHVILGDEASKRLSGLVGKDPLDFAAKIIENLKAQGVTDPEEQMRKVMRLAGRQTSQRYTSEEVANFQQMIAERQRLMGGYGNDKSFDLINSQSVSANMDALKNSWDNLLTAVAGPNSQAAIGVMQSLTSRLNGVTEVVSKMSASTLTNIAEGLGALGVALVGAGVVTMLAAFGPAGWIVLGAAGVATVMHLLAQIDWKAIGAAAAKLGPEIWQAVISGLDSVAKAIASFVDQLVALAGKLAIGVLGALGIDKAGTFSSPGKTGSVAKPVLDGGAGGGLLGWLGLGKDRHPSAPDARPEARVIPQRFDPGQKPEKPQPIALSLNVDGQLLAKAVSQALVSMGMFPTQGAAFDGSGSFVGGDHQHTDN